MGSLRRLRPEATVLHGLSLEEKIVRWLASCKRNERGCLIWEGATTEGYARVGHGGRMFLFSRLILEKKLGRPLKHFALHECDNRACVEETHLFEGTNSDNMRDAWKKGRGVRKQRWRRHAQPVA